MNDAEHKGVGLLVIWLDTHGGLDSIMRKMTKAMPAAPLPVIVYVAPSGGRAASAGFFLTTLSGLGSKA